MLIPLERLVSLFDLRLRGILHLGAHLCEEMDSYLKFVTKDRIVWVEGNPSKVQEIEKRDPAIRIAQAIVSDRSDQSIVLNITNNGESSSILPLGTHQMHYPHIKYVDQWKGKTETVQDIYERLGLGNGFANFLNIDLQGAELLALRGAGSLLEHFDYLYLEVNQEELYQGCGLIGEIDQYLRQFRFVRVYTRMTSQGWGDAFYLRNGGARELTLRVVGGLHRKNRWALEHYRDMTVDFEPRQTSYRLVYAPDRLIDTDMYPDKRFLLGPHCSVLPTPDYYQLKNTFRNTKYLTPSAWVRDLFLHPRVPVEVVPFGIDTERFCPGETPVDRKNLVTVYFKRRKRSELELVLVELEHLGLEYQVFDYLEGYREEDYLDHLQKSQFGVVVGAHESQGFAIQEALACDVPLLVWNVRTMSQEEGSGYDDLPATTVPYWDGRCGELFYQSSELPTALQRLRSRLERYRPREFVLENLSVACCQKRLLAGILDDW
jgi:FkbM family methyltransferase